MANLFLFFSFFIAFSINSFTLGQPQTYIIHMDLSAMPKIFSHHTYWYEGMLSSISNEHDITTPNLLYAYQNAMCGFSARLSPSQLKKLENLPGFVSSTSDVRVTLDTTHSFRFLGLNHLFGAWPMSDYGNGVIIGVVDSGVWPESASYNDDGMTKVPSRWKGECESGTAFNSSMCNKKLIGARFFNRALLAKFPNLTLAMNSPRDTYGHGTHTSSTAAGSYIRGASYFGYATGTARGVAPMARLAMYKAFWKKESDDSGADILAAIDQAISDGVDVLSLSFGVDGRPLYHDSIAIASFAAMERGIFVASSAGNDGPDYATLHNGIPWVITVGAGTLDRQFNGIATLGNGVSLVGRSLYPGKSSSTQFPLVFLNLCSSAKEMKKVGYKIVVCLDSSDHLSLDLASQIYMILESQVAGAIFISNSSRINDIIQSASPTIYLSLQDGQIILDYINKNPSPTARFEFQKTSLGTKPAPSVAAYSSRGPSRSCPDVLKPDLIAPGTQILASWVPENISIARIGSHFLYGEFNIDSGTSMSCPHVAGLAALIRGVYPEWSPAAIRSAMMTTSDSLDNTKESIKDSGDSYRSANPLAMGSGHVNPNKALDPGLIYDADANDYVSLLCSMNYTIKQIISITRSSRYNCSKASLDLNYPSFLAFFHANGTSSSSVREFRRTVTNVGDGASTYTAVLAPLKGFKLNVMPDTLVFSEKYQKQSYKLRVESLGVMNEVVAHGALSWVDDGGKHVVRSPIVATQLDTMTVI